MSALTDDAVLPARRSAVLARALTEVFAPPCTGSALMLALGWTHGGRTGLLWGLIAAVFVCGVPYLIVIVAVRRGHLSDRMVTTRTERFVPLLSNIACAAIGLGVLMAATSDPPELTAFVLAAILTQAGLLAITTVWKISYHAGVTAGVSILVALTYGASTLWVTVPLLVAVCWSRAHLREHTIAQLIAGAVVGGPLLALLYTFLADRL